MVRAYKQYWKNYFQFRGQTSRTDYWWVMLINSAITVASFYLFSFLLNVVIDTVAATSPDSKAYIVLTIILAAFTFVFLVYRLITVIPDIAISYRRYIDTGLPSWVFVIEPLIFIVGCMIFYAHLRIYDTDAPMPIWLVPVFLLLVLADFLIKIMPTDTFDRK
ncbi:DUF805 domain-containing protein [Fructobacillus ficulneus]|uniref:DUF805 domain-containing protein n=1 Tax=Fructobacillus ficulneus TaxID=157463 RepID=A0A0K8MH49_9LACO|nr:DUF805 domain-containing protein [Fructobacillus ficulneus]GAO99891.1 hypothetical protein FFIC_260050 [Fructobacillus ficulneus]